jgi:hypothetical protein
MERKTGPLFAALLLAGSLAFAAAAAAQYSAESGKLKIHVSPKQAYVFVDGKAIRDGSQTIHLSAGNHEVGVYNYGYRPKVQQVSIGANRTTRLSVALQPSGAEVDGPFADIEFKGHPRAAVLLNGTTPDYFVGHVDEFDWDWIWHQRLLVHPGTYHVNVTREGNTIWSGDVTAKAGERVIVNLNNNGAIKTEQWNQGLHMAAQPRFHAGVASATVPIAPVSAQLNAQNQDIGCGASTNLNWKSQDAAAITISQLGTVPATGLRAVSPTKNTTYVLTAKGPGGVEQQSVSVKVNEEPTATLALNEPEVHYHKIGDKVVQQDAATLNWSASNANSVRITPLGVESISGSHTVERTPTQTSTGPVNENVNYTLTATNACGGSVTRTASLHIVGSIDPPPSLTVGSVFFPTNYPLRRHPKIGLVSAEQQTLSQLATHFQNFTQYEKNAKLKLVAHADVRGSRRYNQKLSERRANDVERYLEAHGISADIIETNAVGKTQQLSEKDVMALMSKDPQKPAKWMRCNRKATWLAYNRRVDIVLEPTGQESARIYPDDAIHARLLWERTQPSLSAMEKASKPIGGSASATSAASSSGAGQ